MTIIIPTMKDNLVYLKACVESIKKYSTQEHEIIVISNPEYYDIPIEGIKRLHTDRQGQCGAVNLGVKEATQEYILISDDDVIFPPNWEDMIEKAKEVEFMSGVFVENGSKGGVAAPFITKDYGNTPEDFNWEEWGKVQGEDKWENGFGFPLICKKSFWERIEGYDENYDPWGSNCDSDLEYKVMLAGVMPKRWRGAPTYHFGQVSGIFDHTEYWRKNRTYFEQKWGIRRADCPAIWYCDFIIDGDNLKYKPGWAKYDFVYYKHFELKHTGWLSNNVDLFERFWCGLLGFEMVWESKGKEMFKTLFDIDSEGTVRRYEKDGITIEVHFFEEKAPENNGSFFNKGINHFCLLVDDRDKFLKTYPFDKRIYDNPKGHQNIFIKDFEGNFIEIYQRL